MRVLSYNYRILAGRAHLRPICDVYLIGPHDTVLVRSLIDSGADLSVSPRKAAEDTGMRLSAHPNVWVQYGAAKVPGRKAKAHVSLGGRRWAAHVVFVERLRFPFALLGRIGVFARFNEVAFLEKIRAPRVEFRW